MSWSVIPAALTHRSALVRLVTAAAVGSGAFVIAWSLSYAWLPEGATRFTLGLDYTGELLHETAEGVFGGSLSFPLQSITLADVNDSSCSAPVADGWQTCSSSVVHGSILGGAAFY